MKKMLWKLNILSIVFLLIIKTIDFLNKQKNLVSLDNSYRYINSLTVDIRNSWWINTNIFNSRNENVNTGRKGTTNSIKEGIQFFY